MYTNKYVYHTVVLCNWCRVHSHMPFHFPYHNYLGPGTSDFEAEPVNEADYIAYLHDIAYTNIKTKEQVYKEDKLAIKRFLEDYYHGEGSFSSLVGATGLYFKNFLEETVLQKPLYPAVNNDQVMPPPPIKKPKNWAAIRRINAARRRQRELLAQEAESERQLNQDQQVPGTSGSNKRSLYPDLSDEEGWDNLFNEAFDDQGGDSSSNTNMPPPMDVPTGVDQPMDVQADMARSSGIGGDGANSGGGTGSHGGNDIYSGSTQGNNVHVKEFNKSYHFSLGNGLPEWRRTNTNAYGPVNQLRYNSIHCIPWHRLAMYCSEGEMLRLYSNYSMAEVEMVEVELFSLGVRLPYITGQTVSLVANSMAQYPIGKFHFDRDFICNQSEANCNDIVNKCLGEEWKTTTIGSGTDWSTSFPNLTASTANRVLNNPVIVNFPMMVTDGTQQMFPKDVGIYDYVDIKNGSTAYGLCWKDMYKPKQGILFAKSNESIVGGFANRTPQGFPPVFQNGGQHQHGSRGLHMTTYNNDYVLMTDNADTPTFSTRDAEIENNMVFSAADGKMNGACMPFFMVGMVNVRNLAEGQPNENTVLEGRWDVMLKCKIRVKCFDNVQRGYINRIVNNVPFVYNPFYRFGVTDAGGTYRIIGENEVRTLHGKATSKLIQGALGKETTEAEYLNLAKTLVKNKIVTADELQQYYKEIKDNLKHNHGSHVLHPEFRKALGKLVDKKNFQ